MKVCFKNYDEAPDRPQSIKAFKYLKSCYPELSLHLLLVNVGLNELVHCRKKYISSAIAPACSVLDDSIGCVQWFAARGEGLLFEDEEKPFVPGKFVMLISRNFKSLLHETSCLRVLKHLSVLTKVDSILPHKLTNFSQWKLD